MILSQANLRVAHFCMALVVCGLNHSRAAAGEAGSVIFTEHFESDLKGRWEQLRFGRLTQYSIIREQGTPCLRAVADHACSALMKKVDLPPPTRLIARWKWKIDHIPSNATDRTASTFDHTARIIIAFDTFLGPPRTLNYVWANQEAIGVALPHPLSGRAQMIVLESGNDKAGEWIQEERDVTADWSRLFEKKPMPAIVAIGVITDSENTGSTVTGGYQDIELISK